MNEVEPATVAGSDRGLNTSDSTSGCISCTPVDVLTTVVPSAAFTVSLETDAIDVIFTGLGKREESNSSISHLAARPT